MGWSRGLEHQKLHSAESSDAAPEPQNRPLSDETSIVSGMAERDIHVPSNPAFRTLGRHSFNPIEGVYEINGGVESRATRTGLADIVATSKGKEKDFE